MHPKICFFGEFEEGLEILDDVGFVSAERYREHLDLHRAFLSKNLNIDPSLHRYQDIVEDFWRQLAARTEKPFLGASIHSRFDRCPDLWPDAKYIHMLRDPRDVARSCIGMGWVGNVYHGAHYWLEAERRWDALAKVTSKEQRHEVRYEDLVSAPEEHLKRICAFLGVECTPVLLEYPKHTTYRAPDPSLANQWKHKLSSREILQVESRTADLMVQRGYLPMTNPTTLQTHERAVLALHNRIKRAQFRIKRYGLSLWLQGQLAKRVPIDSFQRSTKRKFNQAAAKYLA